MQKKTKKTFASVKAAIAARLGMTENPLVAMKAKVAARKAVRDAATAKERS